METTTNAAVESIQDVLKGCLRYIPKAKAPYQPPLRIACAVMELCLKFRINKEDILTTGEIVARIARSIALNRISDVDLTRLKDLAICLGNTHELLEKTLENTQGWNVFVDKTQRETMAVSVATEQKQIQSNIQSAAAFLDVDLQVQVVGSVEDLVEDMHAMMDKIQRMEYYIGRAREDATLNRQVDNLMEMAIQLQRGLDFYHHNVSLRNLQSNCDFEESVIASLHQVVDAAKASWRTQKTSRDLPLHEMMEEWMLSSQDIDYNPNNQSTFLGRGASASVYLGRYKGREVAVKHFHSIQVANSMELERSIRKEIKAWREVSTKPFILTLIGVCTKIATPILVCEYCPYTITQYVYMHPEQLIPMVYQLACGLLSLHEAGIIHRDLKGGNVLVTVQGTVAIADFGLSRSTESLLTQYSNTRQFVGTLNWMSPEQRFSPRKMTVQSDIWSFGMTVWQLLCDNIPYRDYSPEEIEEAIRTDDERPGRPEEMSNDNESLWDLITWCWMVDPFRRPKARNVIDFLEIHYAEILGLPCLSKRDSLTTTHSVNSSEALCKYNRPSDHMENQLSSLSEWRLNSSDIAVENQLASDSFEAMWMGKYANEQVTIKTRYQDTDTFTKEVNVLAKIKSPHVVAFIGVSWTNIFDMKMVMEYMDEGDLRTHLQVVLPDDYPWSEKIKHIFGTALGLAYIHAQGIAHGNFKSRQVLLDYIKGAKIANVGASKDIDHDSVRWLAPEVLVSADYSTSADIYSFGVILSEFSTHQIPYHDAISSEGNPLKETAIRTEIVEGNLNLSFSPACPVWILKLAQACLNKVPSMRPTANHLAETIQRNLKNSSVKSSAILSKRIVLLRKNLGTRRKYHSEDYAFKRSENQLDSNEKV